MKTLWKCSLSLAGLYGAAVIGMSAAISHYFQFNMVTEEFSRLVSSTAVLAFQALAILVLSLYGQSDARRNELNKAQHWLLALVLVGFHLGLWCFVYTVWAGLFELPLYWRQLAPVGGQMLILCWAGLMLLPWLRKNK
ncbi:hypothetical protein [Rheinheimera texasensis]|uniref:hypothetical protein n=1 Tax=Rheinheimera texasensis TaxID=306205 RepID=UPI0004E26E12|nr:hypothetical protein [Rheinheimera texasensis]